MTCKKRNEVCAPLESEEFAGVFDRATCVRK